MAPNSFNLEPNQQSARVVGCDPQRCSILGGGGAKVVSINFFKSPCIGFFESSQQNRFIFYVKLYISDSLSPNRCSKVA